jgi:hypothetical protein
MAMSRLEEVDLLTDLPESLREMQEELLQVVLTYLKRQFHKSAGQSTLFMTNEQYRISVTTK